MNQELLQKIVTITTNDPEQYQRRSGDDSALNRFHELFPLKSLPSMTLEQYCIGAASQKESFSWWLESGLKKGIGSYSPGSAKGHLIYLLKGGGYYIHRYFADFGPEKAIEIVRKTLYAIASCSSLEEAKVVDDSMALAKRAGFDNKKYVVSGEARTLRILSMYHPDWMLPINSIDHLKHFLIKLSDEANPIIPEKSIDLVIALSARLDEVRKVTGIKITPWGFSKLLYSEELGIVPPKRDSIYKDDITDEDNSSIPSWWQRFFDSEEQGYAAFELFHEACKGLGVTDTKGATAQRVSFTNIKNGGKERLRLNCGNTLVLEITSNPVEKPNACYIARIEEKGNELTPVGRFTTRTGLMHGLYAADLADLLAEESDSRRMFFNALGDVALIYKNIKKRHFDEAHRPRLLYAAFHDERRADILENGPTRGPSDDPNPISTPSKNRVLYGPPGTGKTYSTIDRALEIIDPTIVAYTMADKDGRAQRKARFDELLQAKRIGFVTFHQSFSYEDFVEGLKASTDEEGQVKYEVEDGIFKQICSAATASSGGICAGHVKTLDPAGRTIWKMSLGNTLGPDASIYDECIENGYVLLGWGQDIDFSGASTRDHIKEKVKERKSDGVDSEYTVTACHAFVNTMKPGDLIIVSDGNHKFRAIGVVKGDYRYLPVAEDREQLYQQCRDVDWIRTYSPSLPSDQLMTVAFSQMSLYRLKPPAIDLDLVRLLLSENEVTETGTPRPFVLIIDEINRGNISRIFGELITLIEESKRTGNPEALTVKLPYSKEMFSVPANLYLIGTMNTADRSLAQLDIALRRRFVFEELMPNPSILEGLTIEGIDVSRMLTTMNQRIEILYDREHTIGHTFFLSLFEQPTLAELQRIFTGNILPLLEEYFFEDWEKIRLVLADNRKPKALAMIVPKYTEAQLEAVFGQDPRHTINPVYQRNAVALAMREAYMAIYDATVNIAQMDSTSLH
jgi:hypothetical protein